MAQHPGLDLGCPVDSLTCRSDGDADALLAGLSSFIGNVWSGSVVLLKSDGSSVKLLASADIRCGVPAVAALPEKDPYTGRTLFASGGDDGSVALWEASTVAGKAELRQAQCKILHDDIASGVAAGIDNSQLASCSFDGTLRLWDCTQLLSCTGQLVGHCGAVQAVAWEPSQGSMVLSAGQDGTIKAWDPRLPSSAACSLAVGAPAFSIALPPHQPNLVLAGDELGRLSAFDWRAAASSDAGRAGRALLCTKLHGDAVRSIACRGGTGSKGGVSSLDVAAGGDDGQVVMVGTKELGAGALSTVKVAYRADVPPPNYVRGLAWGTSGLYRGGWDGTVAPISVQ